MLCWVFVSVLGLSPVAASGGHSSSQYAGLSLSWPLLLQSTGSRRAGSVVVAHGLNCSAACGNLPRTGLEPVSPAFAGSLSTTAPPGKPGQLIFDKGGKTIQWRKDSLFNKWCWENWTATCKRMKLAHSLMPYKKVNSKWIKDLNVRPDTLKLLEENIGRTLYDINQSKILFDPPPREVEIKTKINGT